MDDVVLALLLNENIKKFWKHSVSWNTKWLFQNMFPLCPFFSCARLNYENIIFVHILQYTFLLKKNHMVVPEAHLFIGLSCHNTILRLQFSNLELSNFFLFMDFSSNLFIFIYFYIYIYLFIYFYLIITARGHWSTIMRQTLCFVFFE